MIKLFTYYSVSFTMKIIYIHKSSTQPFDLYVLVIITDNAVHRFDILLYEIELSEE